MRTVWRNKEGTGKDERNLRVARFRIAKCGPEIIRRVFEPQCLNLELQRSRGTTMDGPRSAITMQRNKSGAYRWSKASLHGRYSGVIRTLRRLLEYDGSKPVRSYFNDILLFSANY